MNKNFDSVFHGRPTKQQHPATAFVVRGLQLCVIYAAGMAATFMWGFSQAAAGVCGYGVESCLVLVGNVTGDAAIWPLYWAPKLLGVA